MPETSSANQLVEVVEGLITALQNPHPPTPFLQRGDLTNGAIRQLRIIFNIPNNNNNDFSDNRQLQSNDSCDDRTDNSIETDHSVPRVHNHTNNNNRNNNNDVRARVPIAPQNHNNNNNNNL